MHGTGWLNHLILAVAGTDHWAVLRLATLVALAIDILQIIDC
jgi:hypothetical protein